MFKLYSLSGEKSTNNLAGMVMALMGGDRSYWYHLI
jgi:hypothetical protein